MNKHSSNGHRDMYIQDLRCINKEIRTYIADHGWKKECYRFAIKSV